MSESTGALVKIESVEFTIADWASTPYVSDNLRPGIEQAHILLVPQESFRESTGPIFPQCTEEYYQFLNTSFQEKMY